MKKIILIIIILTNLLGKAQCPAPSNLVYSIINGQDALLSWTENGTATQWDVTVVPNFYVGAPLPTVSYYISSSNQFVFANFPQTGCNVFFVRARCSATVVSQWFALTTSGCSPGVEDYVETLSNESFSFEKSRFLIFPNPAQNSFQIESLSKIDKITVFDLMGKEILKETKNTSEINIENLSKGIYIIEIETESKKEFKKLIKE